MSDRKYVVMKLLTEVEFGEPHTHLGKVQLGGCAGYIPVFDTMEEAEKNACNGKYSIQIIKGLEEK